MFIHTNQPLITSFYIKKYLFFAELAMSQRWSAIINFDNLDDECYNDEWADCMGFDLHRLGELEVEFLNALDWKCHVSVDQFSTVLKQLEVELALNQQSKSGLFTYNTARNLDIMGKY